MKRVGLHLQIEGSLELLANKAINLGLSFFQCFLSKKSEGNTFKFDVDDIEKFLFLRRKYFGNLYLHSSYWINLCDTKRKNHPLLKKELELSRMLEFTHIIFHSGSARGAKHKSKSIDVLSDQINKLLDDSKGLTIVLENTAHGGNAIGSDLKDFRVLLKKIKYKEKLKFCIDIAHAYLFGYDISDIEGQEKFILQVDDIVGWDNVVLIHLNDTKEMCGSKIDHHFPIGEGTIGVDSIKRFLMNPRIRKIPVLLEVPSISQDKQKQLLKKVSAWYSE